MLEAACPHWHSRSCLLATFDCTSKHPCWSRIFALPFPSDDDGHRNWPAPGPRGPPRPGSSLFKTTSHAPLRPLLRVPSDYLACRYRRRCSSRASRLAPPRLRTPPAQRKRGALLAGREGARAVEPQQRMTARVIEVVVAGALLLRRAVDGTSVEPISNTTCCGELTASIWAVTSRPMPTSRFHSIYTQRHKYLRITTTTRSRSWLG